VAAGVVVATGGSVATELVGLTGVAADGQSTPLVKEANTLPDPTGGDAVNRAAACWWIQRVSTGMAASAAVLVTKAPTVNIRPLPASTTE
jgi:hypothetical protein